MVEPLGLSQKSKPPKASEPDSIVIGHSATTHPSDSIVIGIGSGGNVVLQGGRGGASYSEFKKSNPLPMNHPFYYFPPQIDEKYIIGDAAVQHITKEVLSHISDEVKVAIDAKAREVAQEALADNLHYGMYKHLSMIYRFMKYVRNNVQYEDEREKIIYCIDKMLEDPYWSRYKEPERMDP